jgi:hypothetical protein
MLYREIIAVCSEIHIKHVCALCGQNVEYMDVKPGGIYKNQWAQKELNFTKRQMRFPNINPK